MGDPCRPPPRLAAGVVISDELLVALVLAVLLVSLLNYLE